VRDETARDNIRVEHVVVSEKPYEHSVPGLMEVITGRR
jgi:hypothetical protein